MAIRIPTLDAPRVASTAMPTPFENPNAPSVGAAAAGLASQTLGAAAQVELKWRREADQQAVLEAQNSLRAYNDTGLEEVRRADGKNAAFAAQKFYEDAGKKAREISDALQNDDQRRLFGNAAAVELQQSKRISEAHVGQQIAVARDQEFHGALAQSLKRSNDNVVVPGVAEEEAGKIAGRIQSYAGEKGMPKEAVDALLAQEVGRLYSSKARTLLGLGDFQGAQEVVNAHAKELGEDAHEIRGRIELMARTARADEGVRALLGKKNEKGEALFSFPDGTVNLTEADKAIDEKLPAGPERQAWKEALLHRSERAKAGRAAFEASTWDDLMKAYEKNRSYWEAKDSPAWSKATPDQHQRLRDRWEADRRLAENQPLTADQVRAWNALEYDIASRAHYWADTDPGVLDQNALYNKLPMHLRQHVGSQIAQLQVDKSNPDTAFKPWREAALEYMQGPDGVLSSTHGRKPEKWDDTEHAAWRRAQDYLHLRVADWLAQKDNKGKHLPFSEVQGFIDDFQRKVTVTNPQYGFLGGDTYSLRELRAMAPGKRPTGDVESVPTAFEQEKGVEVQKRRGYDPAVTPGAFTTDAIVQASRDWSAAQAGPTYREREAIIRDLRKAGVKNPEQFVLEAYERKRLGYAPVRRK